MTLLNVLYGSLIAGGFFTAAFAAGFILGLWFGKRGRTTSQVTVERPANTHNAGPLPGAQVLPTLVPGQGAGQIFTAPPPSPNTAPTPADSGTFFMEPDRRPLDQRQAEQRMGELIRDPGEPTDAEI